MTVKDFLENFEDKGGSVIRIVADDGSFDTRIGYNYINKKHSMWSNFIAMYGDYLITEWYVEQGFLVVRVKENKGEGKFDYNVSYATKSWGVEETTYHNKVHKSQLADIIEKAFTWGGYDIRISCVERKR